MTESECLQKMKAPGDIRGSKWRNGVIQILVTSSCDKACVSCTQLSQIRRKPWFMAPAQFEQAILSLKGYFGVYGLFGGNPALSPHFADYCEILKKYVPFNQRGIWCNNPLGKGHLMRDTFDPSISNLNVHLDADAYKEFKDTWPESMPFGLNVDSRHSPCYVAMRDVLKKVCSRCGGHGYEFYSATTGGYGQCCGCGGKGHIYDEPRAYDLISQCPVNQFWSALIGVFRGELRAYFCEIAGAQSIYHQDDPEYPDTGIPIRSRDALSEFNWGDGFGMHTQWWKAEMKFYAHQVRKHCHDCGVPMQGYGSLAQSDHGIEQVSDTHAGGYLPKKKGRRVELVLTTDQLGKRLERMTDYIGNAKR